MCVWHPSYNKLYVLSHVCFFELKKINKDKNKNCVNGVFKNRPQGASVHKGDNSN